MIMEKETFDRLVRDNPWIDNMRIRVEALRQSLDRDVKKGFYDDFIIGKHSSYDSYTSYLYQCVLQHFYITGEYKFYSSEFGRDRELEKILYCIMMTYGTSPIVIEQVLNKRRIFHFGHPDERIYEAKNYLEDKLNIDQSSSKICHFGIGPSDFSINAVDIIHATMNIISLISGAITIADFYYKRWSKEHKKELKDKIREQLYELGTDCNNEELDTIIENVIELIKK